MISHEDAGLGMNSGPLEQLNSSPLEQQPVFLNSEPSL